MPRREKTKRDRLKEEEEEIDKELQALGLWEPQQSLAEKKYLLALVVESRETAEQEEEQRKKRQKEEKYLEELLNKSGEQDVEVIEDEKDAKEEKLGLSQNSAKNSPKPKSEGKAVEEAGSFLTVDQEDPNSHSDNDIFIESQICRQGGSPTPAKAKKVGRQRKLEEKVEQQSQENKENFSQSKKGLASYESKDKEPNSNRGYTKGNDSDSMGMEELSQKNSPCIGSQRNSQRSGSNSQTSGKDCLDIHSPVTGLNQSSEAFICVRNSESLLGGETSQSLDHTRIYESPEGKVEVRRDEREGCHLKANDEDSREVSPSLFEESGDEIFELPSGKIGVSKSESQSTNVKLCTGQSKGDVNGSENIGNSQDTDFHQESGEDDDDDETDVELDVEIEDQLPKAISKKNDIKMNIDVFCPGVIVNQKLKMKELGSEDDRFAYFKSDKETIEECKSRILCLINNYLKTMEEYQICVQSKIKWGAPILPSKKSEKKGEVEKRDEGKRRWNLRRHGSLEEVKEQEEDSSKKVSDDDMDKEGDTYPPQQERTHSKQRTPLPDLGDDVSICKIRRKVPTPESQKFGVSQKDSDECESGGSDWVLSKRKHKLGGLLSAGDTTDDSTEEFLTVGRKEDISMGTARNLTSEPQYQVPSKTVNGEYRRCGGGTLEETKRSVPRRDSPDLAVPSTSGLQKQISYMKSCEDEELVIRKSVSAKRKLSLQGNQGKDAGTKKMKLSGASLSQQTDQPIEQLPSLESLQEEDIEFISDMEFRMLRQPMRKGNTKRNGKEEVVLRPGPTKWRKHRRQGVDQMVVALSGDKDEAGVSGGTKSLEEEETQAGISGSRGSEDHHEGETQNSRAPAEEASQDSEEQEEEEKMACPLCYAQFPLTSIEAHASECNGEPPKVEERPRRHKAGTSRVSVRGQANTEDDIQCIEERRGAGFSKTEDEDIQVEEERTPTGQRRMPSEKIQCYSCRKILPQGKEYEDHVRKCIHKSKMDLSLGSPQDCSSRRQNVEKPQENLGKWQRRTARGQDRGNMSPRRVGCLDILEGTSSPRSYVQGGGSRGRRGK